MFYSILNGFFNRNLYSTRLYKTNIKMRRKIVCNMIWRMLFLTHAKIRKWKMFLSYLAVNIYRRLDCLSNEISIDFQRIWFDRLLNIYYFFILYIAVSIAFDVSMPRLWLWADSYVFPLFNDNKYKRKIEWL